MENNENVIKSESGEVGGRAINIDGAVTKTFRNSFTRPCWEISKTVRELI